VTNSTGQVMIQRKHGRDVDHDALARQPPDQRRGTVNAGIGNGNFDVDVSPPRRDLQRLRLHFIEFNGEHLEGHRAVVDDLQHIQRKPLVVADPVLAHQRRICREALD